MMTHNLGRVMGERWPSAGPPREEKEVSIIVLDVQMNCQDPEREATVAVWGESPQRCTCTGKRLGYPENWE